MPQVSIIFNRILALALKNAVVIFTNDLFNAAF